jgi:hypothetical protein
MATLGAAVTAVPDAMSGRYKPPSRVVGTLTCKNMALTHN